MKEQNIAKVYAQSLIELGESNNIDMAKDLTTLTETINASNDLENVLFLDVFTNEEKESVFTAIAEKVSLSAITVSAVKYLITEKRIGILPLIFKEVIVKDDEKKGFLRGTIEGSSESITDAYKEKLVASISKDLDGKKPILDYKVNEEITAGYKVTIGDLQLDATVDNQLKNFKETVLEK